jgi:cellulose synthase/poly-beta-1,6-N-acetylglucosamine synthase-like glycosyltransferase
MQEIEIVLLTSFSIIFYCCFLWFIVFFKERKHVFDSPIPKRFPSVTFLVPIHNGEKYVKKCFDSLLGLEYPKEINIIAIDDGSTDNTAKIVRKYKNVQLIQQERRGKAAAMNNGLKHVKTELVACMDVDSFPKKDYLMKIIGHMEKKGTAVVTPALKVSSSNTLLRKTQWIEYLYMIFLRKAFSVLNSEFVIPGPGGMYKTEALKKIGGFDEDNLTEDTEIAFRFQSKGYKITNSINAMVYTSIPGNFKSLFKQRVRWYRGYLNNVKKYFYMIGNPKYGNLGLFLMPANLLCIFLFSFLLIFQICIFVNNTVNSLIDWSYIGFAIIDPGIRTMDFIDMNMFFALVSIIITMVFLRFSIKYSGEKVELRKKLGNYLSFLFIYPFLVLSFWFISFIYEIFGVRKEW